jgi:hypothetical protein
MTWYLLKAQVDEYASASDSRITIILKSGDVIVDSDIESTELLILITTVIDQKS